MDGGHTRGVGKKGRGDSPPPQLIRNRGGWPEAESVTVEAEGAGDVGDGEHVGGDLPNPQSRSPAAIPGIRNQELGMKCQESGI